MAKKTNIQIRATGYPKTAIPQRGNPGFVVADIFGEHMGLGSSDSAGTTVEEALPNPMLSSAWLNLTASKFSLISQQIDFIRFRKDGTMQEGGRFGSLSGDDEVAGFVLKGREAALDCKIGGTSLNTSYFDLNWTASGGTWKSTLPPEAPRRLHLLNTGSDATAQARTTGNIPANRSLRFDLAFSGLNSAGSRGGFRIEFGGKYLITGKHGQPWEVGKIENGGAGILRKLAGAPLCDLSGARVIIRVRRLDARLVVSIDNYHFHILETMPGDRPESAPRPVLSQWPAAPLVVTCVNVRARIGLMLIKYADSSDIPFSESFSRIIPRKTYLPANPTIVKETGGWKLNTDSATLAVTVSESALSYTCTLRGSAAGIDTPFITKAMIRVEASWANPAVSGIDISAAVTRVEINQAMPPILPGATMTIDIDRGLLSRKVSTNWANYLDDDCPIEFEARWRYDDGSTGHWTRFLKGYVLERSRTLGLRDGPMTLICGDPIIRLTRPSGMIIHRHPPLDFVFINKIQGAVAAGAQSLAGIKVYGGDCAQEILRMFLSSVVADNINGNGNVLRYMPADQYALLTPENDTVGYLTFQSGATGRPITQNGFIFPAPYGEDALTWINQIAALDHAIFYFGWPSGVDYSVSWPLPMYGHPLYVTAGRPVVEVPDSDYTAADVDRLLEAAENSTKNERRFNHFLAWANPPGGNAMEGILPAVRMAESRFDATDVNAPEKSWERTLIMKEDLLGIPGGAEGFVRGIKLLLENRVLQWPTITMRGLAYDTQTGEKPLQWGDFLTFKMQAPSSDRSIGLDGTQLINGVSVNKRFRVEHVQQLFTRSGADAMDFKTTAYTRPVSSLGS